MSFVGGLLGGSSGAGFRAVGPSGEQLQQANTGVDQSIQQQQAFVNALQGQNGLGNQSSVFNQQQNLANQLQGVANGTGPNPAMAQLNQRTGQNISAQNALMAGQRGSGANAGLMARQAAMQGANTQQQAVGQGATMQAQQQLAAMQQLQGQQANMGNLANTQVNQQQAGLTGLNQNTLQRQANLYGLQSNANSANAGIAGQNAGAQANFLGNAMGAIGSVGQMFGGSSGATDVGGGAAGVTGGGAASGVGSFASDMSALAQGGIVKKMAEGGEPEVQTLDQPKISGPQSNVGKMFNDAGPPAAAKPAGQGGSGGMNQMLGMGINAIKGLAKNEFISDLGNSIGSLGSSMVSDVGTMAGGASDAIVGGAPAAAEGIGTDAVMVAAKGGKVPAMVSPGEIYLKPRDVKKIAEGKKSPLDGEKIPGKPRVGGAKDDYANDTVPKTLDEGGIVLPRSVTQAKHPHWAAHKFVSDIMAQKHRKKKNG